MNDTLKAIAASLLMEQVLAPRFEFKRPNERAKSGSPRTGYDYGEGGYDPEQMQHGREPGDRASSRLEIKGLAEPKSGGGRERICREDLNELITAFVQDKTTVEQGHVRPRDWCPEELTQVRMGKIVKEAYPHLAEEDQEAIRQHAVAALNTVQEAKRLLTEDGDGQTPENKSLIDGVRRFALIVTEIDIDLIDRINPFGEAYAILAKSMSEERLKQVAEVIAARRINLTLEEARELAKRALRFKQEKGRLPSLTAADPWEKRMAEGVAFLQQRAQESRNA